MYELEKEVLKRQIAELKERISDLQNKLMAGADFFDGLEIERRSEHIGKLRQKLFRLEIKLNPRSNDNLNDNLSLF